MTEFPRRYGRLSDHLYKFIAALASCHPRSDWPEREEIEMALRFLRRLEAIHDEEEGRERWERQLQRQERLAKKRAGVIKLIPDGNGRPN